MRLQLLRDGFGDFALDSEHVSQIARIGLCPQMRVVTGVDQLRIYSNLVRDSLDAPFQNVSHSERLANVPQIPRCRGLVLRHTCSADHFQIGHLGEISENFILDSVGKKRVLLVIAQIFKRKNRDAFFGNDIGKRTSRRTGRCS